MSIPAEKMAASFAKLGSAAQETPSPSSLEKVTVEDASGARNPGASSSRTVPLAASTVATGSPQMRRIAMIEALGNLQRTVPESTEAHWDLQKLQQQLGTAPAEESEEQRALIRKIDGATRAMTAAAKQERQAVASRLRRQVSSRVLKSLGMAAARLLWCPIVGIFWGAGKAYGATMLRLQRKLFTRKDETGQRIPRFGAWTTMGIGLLTCPLTIAAGAVICGLGAAGGLFVYTFKTFREEVAREHQDTVRYLEAHRQDSLRLNAMRQAIKAVRDQLPAKMWRSYDHKYHRWHW